MRACEFIAGDVLEWAASYDGPPFHALLCDPPYHLTSITERFGKGSRNDSSPAVFQRANRGFMGQEWDGGDVSFRPETWAALRAHLMPGAFIMAFAGTRGYHRMTCAIEDAGFIIHPMMAWVFGSGFPKATRIDTQVDRAAGAVREGGLTGGSIGMSNMSGLQVISPAADSLGKSVPHSIGKGALTAGRPATDLARTWEGHRYGLQAIKPACEMICVGQNPLPDTELWDTITQVNAELELLLCLTFPALDVEAPIQAPHPLLKAVAASSVLGNAAAWESLETATNAGPSIAASRVIFTVRDFAAAPARTLAEMRRRANVIRIGAAASSSARDTATSALLKATSQNIASLWSECLTALWMLQSTSTIETATSWTTDLKTLRLSLARSTSAAITHPGEPSGAESNAQAAAWGLTSLLGRLLSQSATTARETATERPASGGSGQGGVELATICVAQVPYSGRPVECITGSGAGALNIAGGRIGTTVETWPKSRSYAPGALHPGGVGLTQLTGDVPEGRWPANFALACSPDCGDTHAADCPAAELDRQSGGVRSSGLYRKTGAGSDEWNGPACFPIDGISAAQYGDEGGASRFFYCAKPSREERDAGLAGSPLQTRNRVNAGGLENDPKWAPTETRNPHPTLKPIDLCRWLATLLLPPGDYAPRRLLVPFSGTGSEAIAAALAGWECVVGIEQSAEYAALARERAAWWMDGHGLENAAPDAVKAHTARGMQSALDFASAPAPERPTSGSAAAAVGEERA